MESPFGSVIAAGWPVEAAVSKVTMAPATTEPELSLTMPWIVAGAFLWAPTDWAQPILEKTSAKKPPPWTEILRERLIAAMRPLSE